MEPVHVGLSANEPLCIHNGAVSPHALRHAEHFSRSLEEFLEMLANTFLWVAFLRHVPSVASDIHIRVNP